MNFKPSTYSIVPGLVIILIGSGILAIGVLGGGMAILPFALAGAGVVAIGASMLIPASPLLVLSLSRLGVCCLLLVPFGFGFGTMTKLHREAVLSGWIPGARIEQRRVVEKFTSVRRHISHNIMVAAEPGDRTDDLKLSDKWHQFNSSGRNPLLRITVPTKRWNSIRVGDMITVAFYGDDPQVEDAQTDATYDALFDGALLVVELVGCVYAIGFIVKKCLCAQQETAATKKAL